MIDKLKYLKLFEDIDFEDFDWEEEDPDAPTIKVGDIISPGNKVWWNSSAKKWIKYTEDLEKIRVEKVEHSSNIDEDGFNRFTKGSIPYDGYMVKFSGKWPWFKIEDDNNLKENKYFENKEMDFIEDWEEEEPYEKMILDKYDGEGIRVGKYKIDKTDNNLYFFKVPLHLNFQELNDKLFDGLEKEFMCYDPKTHSDVANGGDVVYIEFHINRYQNGIDFGYMPDISSTRDDDYLLSKEEGYGYRWYIENNYKYIGEVEDLI